jgi:hypothetical protein
MQGVALAAHGFLPVAFDDLSRGYADFVRWGPLVQGDILDLAALNAAFERHRTGAGPGRHLRAQQHGRTQQLERKRLRSVAAVCPVVPCGRLHEAVMGEKSPRARRPATARTSFLRMMDVEIAFGRSKLRGR